MFWNHRLIQRVDDPGTSFEQTVLYIVEVYYDEDGSILGWTEKEEVWGENLKAVKQTLQLMIEATEKPILIEADLLAQAEIIRFERREEGLAERLPVDEVLDSLGLEREDVENFYTMEEFLSDLDSWEQGC